MSLFSSLRRLQVTCNRFSSVRTYLSDAYRCEQAWQKRLESPLLSQINLDELYHNIDLKFNQTGVISSVDVDIFITGVQDESHLDEVEDLIFKLRQTQWASELLPSSGHNCVRLLQQCGRTSDLLRILHDRISYGIFVDHHASNLLMDEFLKADQFEEAAKVAVLHGLQEDTSNSITNNLTLMACVQNILKDLSWELQMPEKEEEPKEEVKIRVKFLRNEYFDGHFDMTKGTPLMGKTLAIIAPALKDKVLSRSLELLGWAMFEDWNKLEKKIKSIDGPVLKEVVELIQKQISKSKEAAEKEVPASVEDMVRSMKTADGSLLDLMEKSVTETVKEQESKDILLLENNYTKWEELRQLKLGMQLRENEIRQRTKDVEEKKKYLEEKEQLLAFFENEDKYDLMIERLESAEEERKLEGITAVEETSDYVPPEVQKRKIVKSE